MAPWSGPRQGGSRERQQDLQTIPQPNTDFRSEAVKRLNKKREFNAHLVSYILINLVVWAIWGVIFAASGVWFP